MNRILLLLVLICFSALTVNAQELIESKRDTAGIQPQKLDSISPAQRPENPKPKYINQGKIAGRRAIFSSLMVPGLGQLRNGITVYRLAKVGAIYVGATMLTLSYIDNNKNYHFFLKELIYVREHDGDHPEGSLYVNVDEQGLISAKDLFRRNREVVIFSLVGLYLLNAVEAYVDARLKYFNVDDVAIKFTPDLISTNTMYGFNNVTPGIKLTVTF